jgi:hypothetical protein
VEKMSSEDETPLFPAKAATQTEVVPHHIADASEENAVDSKDSSDIKSQGEFPNEIDEVCKLEHVFEFYDC